MSFALAIFLGMMSPVKKNGKSLKSQAKIVRNAVIYLSGFKAHYFFLKFQFQFIHWDQIRNSMKNILRI